MTRTVLSLEDIHPAIHSKLGGGHDAVLDQVKQAIASKKVVVIGMKINPFVKKARKLLSEQGIEFTYLEYGSYFAQWHPRLAIKMWTGFKTYPQVFVNGTLIGGYSDVKKLVDTGELAKLLGSTAQA